MKNNVISIAVATAILAFGTGCTYKLSDTATSTKLDGTQVDYSKMDKYIKTQSCIKFGNREDASMSILKAAQKAGISKVKYVDISTLKNENCIIVYGE